MKSLAVTVISGLLYMIIAGASRHLPTSDAIWPWYSGDVVLLIAWLVAFIGGAASATLRAENK